MARKTETKEIDGFTFIVTQLSGKRGARLHFKLVRLVAPAVAKAVGSGKLSSLAALKDLDLSNLGDAVQLLAEKLTPDEFEAIRDELLGEAFVMVGADQMPLMRVYDDVMAGHVTTGLKLLKFALEVNFGNFFGAFLATPPAGTASA